MDVECTVTIVASETGLSETIPVSLGTTVKELAEWSTALLGLQGDVVIYKDGNRLDPEMKLEQAGVQNGDLLAAQVTNDSPPAEAAQPAPAMTGLDFSSILQSATAAARAPPGGAAAISSATGGLDFSNLLLSQQHSMDKTEPVYFPGMTLNEALDYNTNPEHIVILLQTRDHLFKELNYHQPVLANKLRNQPYEKAVQIWREEILKGGIQSAVSRSTTQRKEQDYRQRLEKNRNDKEAKEYFDAQERETRVREQYFQMMQEYPESLGRVLMLYIEAKVNGHAVQSFVDSGAQNTIMSKKTATICGLMDMLDTRFRGIAVGVGTGTILGRIHIVQLQLGDYYFPCTITIMDDPAPGSEAKDMPFLLGLDMLKRHTCSIDLENQKLKFRLAPGKFFETPFLHEKDLDESQGGTKGFDAEKANEELAELQRKHEEEDSDAGAKMNDD